MYNKDFEYLSHYKGMTLFLTKHIFDMLYQKQYQYSVSCFIDGDHEWIHFENVRQFDAEKIYARIKYLKLAKCDIDTIASRNGAYSCDWCSIDMRDWNFMYPCKAHYADQHYYCLNCTNTVITLNKELKKLLNQLLENELIDDCVQSIVDYVVGKVVERH